MERFRIAIKQIILLLFLLSQIVLANFASDSLKAELQTTYGKEKVDILIKLFRSSIYENPKTALEYANEALKITTAEHLSSLTTYSYIYIGLAYYFMNQWRVSNDIYQKALRTEFAKSNSGIRATLINNIALNYKFLGEYKKSISYIFDAIKVFEEIGDSASIAKGKGNLGVLYLKLDNPNEAIKHFTFSLPIFQKLKDSISIANDYENLSSAYFYKSDSINGEKYFQLAEEMMYAIGNSSGVARLYYEHGENLFAKSFYSKAFKYYSKSIEFCDSSSTPNQYYLSIEGMGKALLYSNKVTKAEEYLQLAKQGFQKLGANESIWKTNLDLAKLYSKKDDWENFNKYFNLYDKERNTYLREKENGTVAELNLIYETEKKNQQIFLQKSEIKNKNNRIIFLSTLVALIFIGLLITIYLSRKLKFANKNLIDKNLELSERWKQLQKFYGSAESESTTTSQNQLFRKIYLYMVDEQAFTNCSITVDYLSKQLSSNTKYISKAIKEETGMNFNTFINTFRIEEAKRILRDKISSTWSLDAVAEQSGFNNTTSFFQAFKKNTGLTPSAFRNALVTSLMNN